MKVLHMINDSVDVAELGISEELYEFIRFWEPAGEHLEIYIEFDTFAELEDSKLEELIQLLNDAGRVVKYVFDTKDLSEVLGSISYTDLVEQIKIDEEKRNFSIIFDRGR